MNSAQAIADQAIAKMEAEDNGTIPKDDDTKKGGQDDKGTDTKKTEEPKKGAEDDKDSKSGTGEDDSKTGDKGTDKPKEDEEEGTFTADDAVEVEEKPQDPKAPTDNAGIVLSPQEQKYIADNIGEPIIIRGIRGSGDNAKEVEIKAYSPTDIPADFKFANDRELVAAQNGFQALEQKAGQLLGNYRQNQSQQAAQDFERRENEGIKADVADLQKEGRFPKFKVQPGQPGFDNDPAAQQMSEVLKVMTDKNEMYLKQYEQGRPYKHIGFAEAYDIWERSNPGKQAEKKTDDDQKKEDQERGKTATNGSANRGTESALNIRKPTVKSGTTTRDILARIDMEE
jgi:hypothetical protein